MAPQPLANPQKSINVIGKLICRNITPVYSRPLAPAVTVQTTIVHATLPFVPVHQPKPEGAVASAGVQLFCAAGANQKPFSGSE